ncbi:MAG: ABC transporter ATP-binding protein [Rhodobacteraceae bacterium]|nr:ABC transporter ATP-binding protein [Paracoccaceae bacterium]
MSLLDIRGLSVSYGATQAVRAASLRLEAGGSLGLVGESGSGKTTLALALLGLLPANAHVGAGTIAFDGADLLRLSPSEFRRRRWIDLAYVPQGAMNALDPVRDLDHQFDTTLRAHRRAVAAGRAADLFARVGLEERWLRHFPHEFSGGMRQRAAIALAMLFAPRLLVADEPTTGLDVVVQRQVLDLLGEARRDRGMALVLVSHDLAVVSELCEHLAVLYAGEIVESGRTGEVLRSPAHPYAMGLRRAITDLRQPDRSVISIAGAPPALNPPPPGCAFAARCPFALPACRRAAPPLATLREGRQARCHRAGEAAALWAAAQDDAVWNHGA